MAYALVSSYSNFEVPLEKRMQEIVQWYMKEFKKGTYDPNNKI
jgi:hypothetical protein